jgi:hypothetical protein
MSDMEPAHPAKLLEATEHLLHKAYAVNRRSGDEIDGILCEASLSRDYPPSTEWVAPFVKMTAACAKRIPDWGLATFDLVRSAEQVAPYLVEQKCGSECLAVYELLLEFLIENDPLKSSFVEGFRFENLLSHLTNRDDIIQVELILHENLTMRFGCKSHIRRTFDDWVSAKRGGLWSAQYMLSVANSTQRCGGSSLYERMDFRRGFDDPSLRRLHLKIGWPLLMTAFTTSDRDFIRSMFVL